MRKHFGWSSRCGLATSFYAHSIICSLAVTIFIWIVPAHWHSYWTACLSTDPWFEARGENHFFTDPDLYKDKYLNRARTCIWWDFKSIVKRLHESGVLEVSRELPRYFGMYSFSDLSQVGKGSHITQSC